MVKMKRLFPVWNIPIPDEINGHFLKASVNCAKSFSEQDPDLQVILPFDMETQKVEMQRELSQLLRFKLIPNPSQRPSPLSVLESRELRAFENLVATDMIKLEADLIRVSIDPGLLRCPSTFN